MEKVVVYVLSDSIGETAQQVAKAALAQFEIDDISEIKRFGYVNDKKNLLHILSEAKKENAIIVYTLVTQELSKIVREFCDNEAIKGIDLITDVISSIVDRIGENPKREPGIIRKLDEKYFKRVEAIEFAVKYDDGKDPRGILKADIILIGISRTSKTPLSMYLANKNLKVANVPLVPEIAIPKQVFEIDKSKIIGLTNSPEVLNSIRQERLKTLGLSRNAGYANMDRIEEELEYSKQVMDKLGCPVINVANRAIEETADIILKIIEKNK